MGTTEAILILAVYILTGRANAECVFGNGPIDQSTFNDTGGQYLNLDNPADCSGRIVSWRYCYHLQGIRADGDYNVWLRVWRLVNGMYTQQSNYLLSVQLQPQANTGFTCENLTLQQSTEVLQGDIIGVYIPDGNLPGSQPQNPLYVTTDTGNETAYRLHFDTRGGNNPFSQNSVVTDNLREMRGLALHLYANIVTAPPASYHCFPLIKEIQASPTTAVPSPATQLQVQSQSSPITPSRIQPQSIQSSIQPQSNSVSVNVGPGPTKNEGLSSGAIAAIAVVVVIIVLLSLIIVIVGTIVWKRRRQSKLQLSKNGWNNSTFSLDNAMYEDIPIRTNVSPARKKSTKVAEDYEIPVNSKNYEENDWVDSFEDVDPEVNEYVHMQGEQQSILLSETSHSTNQAHQENMEATDLFDIYASFGPTNSEYCKFMEKATSVTGSEEFDPYNTPPAEEEEIYEELSKQNVGIIQRESIEITSHLGSGQFASVDKGVWKSFNGTTLEVAVKTLSNNAFELDKVKFLQEAAIMCQFKHPNVVRINGVVMDKEAPMLVIEYLSKGDLRNCLHEMRPDHGQLVPANTAQLLLSYSQQIALGMHYLTSKAFVHRDLAARNVFVSKDNICKIGDFGMSRDLADAEYYVSQGGTIPVRWTAPEAIYFRKYSAASDVWSYGCLLYEIWSLGYKPFKGYSNTEILQKLDSGYRLPPPPGCPRVIYELMIKCWYRTPSLRPNFRDILAAMLDDEATVLSIPVDDASSNEHASILGASLEAGKGMYTDLQQVHLATSAAAGASPSLQESLPLIYTANYELEAVEDMTKTCTLVTQNEDQGINIYDTSSTPPFPAQSVPQNVDEIYSDIADQVPIPPQVDIDYEDIDETVM